MEFTNLKKTPIYNALSMMGKEIFQPNGIFYWAGRANNEAEIDATVGTATGLESEILENGRDINVPFFLPELKNYISVPPERFVNYAPMGGVAKLRELWQEWIIYKAKIEGNLPSGAIDLSEKLSKPIICNGITNAIFIVGKLFLNPGESIICPEKRWGNYNSILTKQNGITIQDFTFFKDGQFNLKSMLELMEKVAQEQQKVVLLLNFPNNPTGYCPTPAEIKALIEGIKNFCKQNNVPVVVLCDDAYEGYVYTNERVFQSVFNELVDIHPNIIPIKMDGASKEMLMYGARIAAITLGYHTRWFENASKQEIDSEWNNKLQAMIRSTISNCNHFSQEVLVDILGLGFDKMIASRQKTISILQERYQASIEALAKYATPKVTMDPAGGGFFVFLNIEEIDAEKLADHILIHYKLGTIPFVNKKSKINGLRVAYCSIEKQFIDETFKRIDAGVRDLLKV